MIRRITFTATLLLCACGDDSHTTQGDASTGAVDAGKSGAASAAEDSGASAEPPITPDIVTNVGVPCRGANACKGANPTCQTMLSLLGQAVPFPGGYCSTPCSDNHECGVMGECPVGESLKTLPAGTRALVGSAAPSHCYERCSHDADCRTDEKYRCTTIVAALSEGAGGALNIAGFDVSSFLMGPIVDSKYCLPPAPEVPDAGPASVDAGQGVGALDAAAADSATGDAGADV